MIADCDRRIAKLIQREVLQTLRESYGSVYVLEITKIEHHEDVVNVFGWFQVEAFKPEHQFAVELPRVDGPLDYFL